MSNDAFSDPTEDYQSYSQVLMNRYALEIDSNDKDIAMMLSIQAAIELSWKLCTDYDFYSREIYKIAFSLYAMLGEIEKLMGEVELIRLEVNDLYNSMLKTEFFNTKLLEVVKDLSLYLLSMKDSYYTITASKKESIKKCLFRNEVQIGKIQQKNNAENDVPYSEFTANFTADAVKRLEYLHQIFKLVNELHTQFSFLLIYMFLKEKESNKSKSKLACAKKKQASKSQLSPHNILPYLHEKISTIGGTLNKEVITVRDIYVANITRQEELMTDIQRLKRILFDTLLQLQAVVHYIADLDEKNDALVGKLMKTRPLFKKLHDLLSSEFDMTEMFDENKQRKPLFTNLSNPFPYTMES